MAPDSNNVFRGYLTGFQVYSTEGPTSTIPQPFIQDTAQILEQMRNKGSLKRLLECITLLNFHIGEDVLAHDFQLEQFATALLYELYCKYRQLGYLTDQEEMYVRLFYDQKLAEWSDVYKGREQTKAVNVPQFRWIFDQHDSNLDAHHGVFAEFLPKSVCQYDPTIYLSSMFASTCLMAEYLTTDGRLQYPLGSSNWGTGGGTLVCSLNFNVDQTSATQVLWSLSNSKGMFQLVITATGLLQLLYQDPAVGVVTLFNYSLEVPKGERIISLAYDPEKIRLYLNSDLDLPVAVNPMPVWNFDTLTVYPPLKDDKSLTSLAALTYYPRAIFDKTIQAAILA